MICSTNISCGPTCCRKSQLVKRFLEAEYMIDGAPGNVIWCYGLYQTVCDEMLRTISNIIFVEGVPRELETVIDPSVWNLVVIHDLMQELDNDQRITNLFTKGCHHRNLSVIFILFHRVKELRDMSLNCHYLFLFKSPRDSSQVNDLARQIFPGHVKYMQYMDGDLKPETPIYFRLRANIFSQVGSVRLRERGIKRVHRRNRNQLSMAQQPRKNHDFLARSLSEGYTP